METFSPKLLSIEPAASILAIIPRVENNNMVIVLGAGVSMGPPMSLPSGTQLTNRVMTRLAARTS